MEKNIILFGIPRSGTTWLSQVLTADNDLQLIHEPDNELISFLGLVYKTNLPRFPYLKATESSPRFYTLFKIALENDLYAPGVRHAILYKLYNKPKNELHRNLSERGSALSQKMFLSRLSTKMIIKGTSQERTLIKSVHSILSIPFLMKHFDIIPLLIRRNPLNVFSSYKALNMPDQNRDVYLREDLLQDYDIEIDQKMIDRQNEDYKAGFQLGVFNKVLGNNISDYNEIVSAYYEEIISNPYKELKNLFEKLSLDYTMKTEDFIQSRFKPGSGYETYRVPEKQKEVWKERLTNQETDNFLNGYKSSFGKIDFEM